MIRHEERSLDRTLLLRKLGWRYRRAIRLHDAARVDSPTVGWGGKVAPRAKVEIIEALVEWREVIRAV
jgi:hypothetical protein